MTTRLLDHLKWCYVWQKAGVYVTSLLTNQKTESFVYSLLRALALFDVTRFPHLSEHLTSFQAFWRYVKWAASRLVVTRTKPSCEYLRMNVRRGLSCPPSRPAMAVFRAPRRASSCITPTVTSGMEELTRAWLHNTITQMDAVVKINIAFIAVRFYKYVAFLIKY